MAGADDFPRNAELVAQADIETVGEHDQTGRDRLAIGERNPLPLRAGLDRSRLGADALDVPRDIAADGVDQGIVDDVELSAWRLIGQTAEARDPVLASKGGAAQDRFSNSGL
ncbi:hypothetical protein ACVWY3_001525 [Bradyrhizobium sp. USDA 4486]